MTLGLKTEDELVLVAYIGLKTGIFFTRREGTLSWSCDNC